jgi:hypothetical protein
LMEVSHFHLDSSFRTTHWILSQHTASLRLLWRP